MKLNRPQKASFLKEIGNLISYFETPEQMDVEKFINILKGKYVSWNEVSINDDSIKTVSNIINNLEGALEEKLFIDKTEIFTETKDNEVDVYGSNVSVSNDLMVWDDEKVIIEKDTDVLSTESKFTFTGFSTNDFQQTNDITITPEEFWSDEVNEDEF